jgi:hypothetical protein
VILFLYPHRQLLTLFVQESNCTSNDQCSTAVSIESLPYIDSSSTEFATAEDQADISSYGCVQLNRDQRLNWYKYTGAGKCVKLSVYAAFSPYMAVLDGDDCQSLNCKVEQIYSNTEMSFLAELDKVYWILVGGAGSYDIGAYSMVLKVSTPVYPCVNILVHS